MGDTNPNPSQEIRAMTKPDPQTVDALFDRLTDLSPTERARELSNPRLDPAVCKRVERLLECLDTPSAALDDLGLDRILKY